VRNRTGGPIYGWVTTDWIPISDTEEVRPVIYENCRNGCGFKRARSGAPVQTASPPPAAAPAPANVAPPQAPTYLAVPLYKTWVDKKGNKTKAPKHYRLGFTAYGPDGPQIGTVQLTEAMSSVTFDHLQQGQYIRVAEDQSSIPKGWAMRSESFATVAPGASFSIVNEKVGGKGFCGPAKVICWGIPVGVGVAACIKWCHGEKEKSQLVVQKQPAQVPQSPEKAPQGGSSTAPPIPRPLEATTPAPSFSFLGVRVGLGIR
jgi:hypothetical protein